MCFSYLVLILSDNFLLVCMLIIALTFILIKNVCNYLKSLLKILLLLQCNLFYNHVSIDFCSNMLHKNAVLKRY